MKKLLMGIAFALCAMVPCATMFTGCGEKEMKFTANEDISQGVMPVIMDIQENYYNQFTTLPEGQTKQHHTVAELKEADSDFVYYIEVGEVKNVDKVKKVQIGDATFQKDQEFSLSIGNSHFITDKAFVMDGKKLLVAVPAVFFEITDSENDKIKINGKTFDLGIVDDANLSELEMAREAFTSVENSAGSTNVITAGDGEGEYNLTINNGTKWVAFGTGTANDTLAFTKKTLTRADGAVSVSYGFTMVGDDVEYAIAFYPVGWAPTIDENVVSEYNGLVLEYEALVEGTIFHATLNLTVVAPEA